MPGRSIKKRTRRVAPKYVAKTKNQRYMKQMINRAIKQNNNRMIETKHSNTTSPDGTEIYHNNFVTLTSKVLKTTEGVQDPTIFNSLNRIGDKINVKGVKIKMMVELNERYSDVSFRLMVVRCARGDTPTRATLFNGLSGNKMIDTINSERYTVLFQKYFKMRAPNSGTIGALNSAGGIGSGINDEYTQNVFSRGTRVISAWIPGTKFSRTGVITYNNATEDPKFFDYHALLYAYSNYSTDQDLYYVGRVNDYIQILYFKDA